MPAVLAPRFWAAHLVGLVLTATAGLLGFWQWESWQDRRAAEALDLTQLEPVPLSDVLGPDDPFPGDVVGRPVTVSGVWVPSGTVLVEGREHEGRQGYWVVTPLAVGDDAGAPALPVVRGWIEDPADLPDSEEGSAELTAWLQPPEGSTALSDSDPTDDIIPQVRTADLIQHVDQDLYGAYGVATEPTPGLVAADLEALPDAGRFTALRNLLYALEWWVFAGFAAFLWWRYLADAIQRERAEPDPVPSDA